MKNAKLFAGMTFLLAGAASAVTVDSGTISGLGARNIGSAAMSGRIAALAAYNTPDGKVTLRTAECLASCGTAPMMQVDKEYHENLTPQRVDAILGALVRGSGPPSAVLPPRPSSKPPGKV